MLAVAGPRQGIHALSYRTLMLMVNWHRSVRLNKRCSKVLRPIIDFGEEIDDHRPNLIPIFFTLRHDRKSLYYLTEGAVKTLFYMSLNKPP